jgi:hypothetical protein
VRVLEMLAGRAALDALVEHPLEDHRTGGCTDPGLSVWGSR